MILYCYVYRLHQKYPWSKIQFPINSDYVDNYLFAVIALLHSIPFPSLIGCAIFFQMSSLEFSITQLESFLQGQWTLTRHMDNGRNQETGKMVGQVEFTLYGSWLLYREEGIVSMQNYQGPFFQEYKYYFPTPNQANICFSDEQFFHTLDLSSGYCKVQHVCGQDNYQGIFKVLSPKQLKINWQIRGPCKDMRVETLITKHG